MYIYDGWNMKIRDRFIYCLGKFTVIDNFVIFVIQISKELKEE
jgi:hypothetical protein